MAAVAPYNAQLFPGYGAYPGPMGMAGPVAGPVVPVDMASRLRRLFLELKPLEEKQWEAQQLVQQVAQGGQTVQVGPCVKAILEQLAKPCVPLRWMQVLSVQMLSELLRLHPNLVSPHISKSDVVWLFPEHGDVEEGAKFLRDLLWTKASLGQSCDAEAWKFARLLMKRTDKKDLAKVPCCPARAWLVQIWKDVPSARPKRDLLVSCCVRWVADPYEAAQSKTPCLELLQEEASKRSAVDAETWILSLIFQEVCRQPMQHSPDLQQLLLLGSNVTTLYRQYFIRYQSLIRPSYTAFRTSKSNFTRCFLRSPPSPSAVRSLITGLSDDSGYLMTLWACLSHWPPQTPLLPTTWANFPLYALLRGILVAFSQLKDVKTSQRHQKADLKSVLRAFFFCTSFF